MSQKKKKDAPFKATAEVTLCGEVYELFVSFAAVMAFEDKTGKAPMTMIARLASGHVKLSELRDLLWCALLTKYRNITQDEVGEMLGDEFDRFQEILGVVLDVFARGLDKRSDDRVRPIDAQAEKQTPSSEV